MPSSEAYKRSLAQRVSMNRAILKNPYWFLPVEDKGHEDFMPVGRGVPSSELCAKHVCFKVCKNVKGHEGLSVGGEDSTGKVVVHHKHLFCHKSTCPKCFIRGWSQRGADNITRRLEKGVDFGFGKVEHIVVAVNPADFDLPEKVLRKKSRKALKVRGVVGGCQIFHGFRIDKRRRVLVWSPHYHSLSFIEGGFDRCRKCVHVREDCLNCSGFKGREVREYKKDGYIVTVLAEREKSYYDDKPNIFGTAFYQLNHATVRVGLRRFHVVTWMGCCGNRKYASPKVVSKDSCPLCGEEMVRCAYVGKRFIPRSIGHADYKAWFLDDEFDENGEENYPEVVGGRGYG